MRIGPSWLCAAAAAGLLLVATAARADEQQEVKEEFELGLAAEQGGDDAAARQHYLNAYRLIPSGPIAANLGLVETRLELWADAAAHLTAALEAELPEGVRPDVEAILEETRGHVGTLDITVEPSAAAVSIDGEVVGEGRAQLAAFVTPGTHKVRADLDGFAPTFVDLIVATGERTRLRLVLHKVAHDLPPPPAASDSPSPAGRRGRVAPETIVLLAGSTLTLVTAGVGAGFAASSHDAAQDAQILRDGLEEDPAHSYCFQNDEPACTQLDSAVDRQRENRDAAQVTFAVAGGLAVGTVAGYFIVHGLRKRRAETVRMNRMKLLVGPQRVSAVMRF